MIRLLALLLTVALALPVWGQKHATKLAAKGPSPAALANGKAIYEQNCLTCHQADGTGVPSLNPPLTGTSWVTGPKPRLIGVILHGMQGQEIDGKRYHNIMAAHDFLTDQQVADLLTYVRRSFGNAASSVTAAEVKAARKM